MLLEEALNHQAEQIETLIKAAKKHSSALSGWKKACQSGNVVALQKSGALVVELAATLALPTTEVASSWSFDLRGYLETDAWRKELLAACAEIGHRVIEEGDTVVSPPLIVRAQPGSGRLLLGKTGWPTLNPRVTAAHLKKLSEKSASAATLQQFLNSLYEGAKKVSRQGNDYATFKDIYDLFAFAPGWAKENSKASFAQQIYALDRSEVRTTKDNKSFRIEKPSGPHKPADVFSVITDEGIPMPYYGIWFK